MVLILKIVNFPFLDGDVPRFSFYGVYISKLIRFARVSSNVMLLLHKCVSTANLAKKIIAYESQRILAKFMQILGQRRNRCTCMCGVSATYLRRLHGECFAHTAISQ